ncbi:hypothetical protein IWW50_003598 [Coemansia erecta]|nr:hypothetical protein IWW50_003598 [Coemansia erecta]
MTVLKHLLERCGLDGLSINHIQPEGQTDVYIILHKNGISEAWRAHASLTFVYCQHKQMRMEVVASYSRYKRTLMFQRRLTTYVMFQVLSHCTSGIRDRQICEIANVVIDHVLDNKQFDSDDEVFTTMFDFGLDGSGWSRVQAALRKPHMRLRVNRLVVQTLAARAALIDPSILGYTCEQANNMVRRQVDWTTMKCIGGMSATAFLRATRTARWFSDGCGNIIKMVNPNTKRPFTYATGRKCDVIPMFSVPVCGVYESMDDSVYYLQASSMCAVLQNGALIKSAEPSDSSGDTDDSNALIKCNQCDFATTVEFKFHTHYQVHQLEESPGLSYERQSRKQVTEEYAERKQIAASLNTLLPGPSLDGMKVEFTYEQALRFLRFARRNNCKVAEFDPNSIFAEQHPLSEQFLIKKLRELLFKPKETGRPESITTVLRKALKMVKRVQAHHRRITTLQSRIGESSQNKRRRVE